MPLETHLSMEGEYVNRLTFLELAKEVTQPSRPPTSPADKMASGLRHYLAPFFLGAPVKIGARSEGKMPSLFDFRRSGETGGKEKPGTMQGAGLIENEERSGRATSDDGALSVQKHRRGEAKRGRVRGLP